MVKMAELQRSIAMELNKKLEGTYQLVLIEGVSWFWFIHVHTGCLKFWLSFLLTSYKFTDGSEVKFLLFLLKI